MSRTITVVTPENIEVTYQVAGFASRFLATLADLIVQFVLVMLVWMMIRWGSGAGLGSIALGLGMVLIAFVIPFVYATFFEMLWGGRTPGKRLFGLRVIRDGGYPINLLSSVIRNVLRFLDFGIIPLGSPIILCGLPGLLTIFFSPSYKRLGDYAAGTLVIVEQGVTPLNTDAHAAPLSPMAAYYAPWVRNLDRVTREEYQVVRRFTSRRGQLAIAVQASLGERLARPLMEKMEIAAPIHYQLQYADVLEAIERGYANERGIL